jgi:ribose-phosphate pyrophosphokinase
LKKKNAGDLYLAVSHGIFSKGFDDLCKHFKGIYTTNSFKDIEDARITQIKLEELL